VHARLHLWFEQRPFRDRRNAANGLKRAQRQTELLEEKQIDHWLELGYTALQETNFPTPKGRRPERQSAVNGLITSGD
jgi:hypothetical protein